MNPRFLIALLSFLTEGLSLFAQPIAPYEDDSSIPFYENQRTIVDQQGHTYAVLKNDEQTYYWINKYNTTGEKQWDHLLTGLFPNHAVRLHIGPTGGVYVYGALWDSLAIDMPLTKQRAVHYASNDKQWQFFLCHFSANGELKWTRMLEDPALFSINDLQVDRQSNIYLIGNHRVAVDWAPDRQEASGIHSDSTVHSKGFLLKLDSTGQHCWKRSFLGSYEVDAQLLRLDASQRFAYLVTRWTTPSPLQYSSNRYWGDQYYNEHLLYDSTCLYKLHTSTGRVEWRRDFSGPQNLLVQDMDLFEDKHLYIAGRLFLPNDSSKTWGGSPVDDQGVLVKLDSAGRQLWVHRYQSTDVVKPKAVQVGPEGEAYVLGHYHHDLTIPLSHQTAAELRASDYEFFTQRCHGYFVHFLNHKGTSTGVLNLCSLGEQRAKRLLALSRTWYSHPDLRSIYPMLHPLDTATWVVLYKDNGVYHSSYRLPLGQRIADFAPIAVDSFDEETFEAYPNGLFSNEDYQVEIIKNRRSKRLPYYWRFRRKE